jgi:hypothetical protein
VKNSSFLTLALTAAIFTAAALAAVGTVAYAADDTVVVTEADIVRQAENTPPTGSWVLYTRTSASTGDFRLGPTPVPAGIGSLELGTPTGADKVTLFNFDHVGMKLNEVTALSYSTYRSAGSAQQVAALNIQVDYNGDAPGGFTTLVFEPVYNTDQGAVLSDVWQSWDAYKGGNAVWWSSNAIPGAPNRDTFVSWNTILAANPDAEILGGFGVNQGSGNGTLKTAVDVLKIGDSEGSVTYNFEPYKVAATKDDCKLGGWQTVKRADGSSFSNQGLCVSYVTTGN